MKSQLISICVSEAKFLGKQDLANGGEDLPLPPIRDRVNKLSTIIIRQFHRLYKIVVKPDTDENVPTTQVVYNSCRARY